MKSSSSSPSFRTSFRRRIIDRPKHPYRAPINRSLLIAAGSKTAELLMEPALRDAGLFDTVKVRRLVQKVDTAGHASEMDNMALVGIVSTQMVYDQFVRNFNPEPMQINGRLGLLIDKRSSCSGAPTARAACGQGS